MSAPENIVVVGAGGHGGVIADIIAREGKFHLCGFVDGAKPKDGSAHGHPILGSEPELPGILAEQRAIGGVVAVGDNWTRSRVVERIRASCPAFRFVTAIHPSAQLAGGVQIREGTVVMAGAIVNPGSVVGRHCILNTRSSLDHDCRMEDFSSLAPAATTGGTCSIGAWSAISIGAVLRDRIKVGAHAVIGAGACVLKDVPSHVIAFGVPAKVIRPRTEGEKYL